MSFKSNKSSSSESTTVNNTTSKPITLQDVEGMTIAGSDNVNTGLNVGNSSTVAITDGGAIEKMAEVTMAFLTAQNDAAQNALNFAYEAGRPEADVTKNQTWAMVAAAAVVAIIIFGGKH